MIHSLKSILDIKDHYDTFLFDLVGVIHNGKELFPHANKAVMSLIDAGKIVVFVSNMPRPRDATYNGLHKMGLMIKPEQVYTSGDALRHAICYGDNTFFKETGKPFYQIGADMNKDLLAGLDMASLPSMTGASFALFTGWNEENDPEDKWDKDLHEALSLNLPLIIANPDVEAMHGETVRKVAGFFGKRYESMGGKSLYYGKPYLPFYEWLFEKLKKDHAAFDKKRAIMIGDTIETDVEGAKNAKIDALLMLSGNTGRELQEHHGKGDALREALVKIKQEKALPITHVMDEINV